MKSQLDQIESRLQSIIEGSADLLPWANRHGKLARILVESMQDSFLPDQDLPAPNLYTIHLNPEDPTLKQDASVVMDALERALSDCAREIGIHFITQPVIIRLMPDTRMAKNELRVVASNAQPTPGETRVNETRPSLLDPFFQDSCGPGAFLIINGTETFPLQQMVVNIGRRSDNHIVIEDPRVSRVHAQIRMVQNQYVIFDLNSTGGTWVNGRKISQQALEVGDVISLAGVSIIYGEENSPTSGGDTGKIDSDLPPRRHP